MAKFKAFWGKCNNDRNHDTKFKAFWEKCNDDRNHDRPEIISSDSFEAPIHDDYAHGRPEIISFDSFGAPIHDHCDHGKPEIVIFESFLMMQAEGKDRSDVHAPKVWQMLYGDSFDAPIHDDCDHGRSWLIRPAKEDEMPFHDDYDPRKAEFIRAATDDEIMLAQVDLMMRQIAKLETYVARLQSQMQPNPNILHYQETLEKFQLECQLWNMCDDLQHYQLELASSELASSGSDLKSCNTNPEDTLSTSEHSVSSQFDTELSTVLSSPSISDRMDMDSQDASMFTTQLCMKLDMQSLKRASSRTAMSKPSWGTASTSILSSSSCSATSSICFQDESSDNGSMVSTCKDNPSLTGDELGAQETEKVAPNLTSDLWKLCCCADNTGPDKIRALLLLRRQFSSTVFKKLKADEYR